MTFVSKGRCVFYTLVLFILIPNLSAAQNGKDENLEKAKIMMVQGDYDQAAALLQKLLADNPDDYDIVYNLGLNYQALSNYIKASDFFEKAVKLKPGKLKLHILLGRSYFSSGRLSDADSVLRYAFIIDSTNTLLLRSLGEVYMREHKWIDADEVYNILGKQDSTNSFYFEQQARCEYLLKDIEGATINFQIAHRLNPQNENTIMELGRLYSARKKYMAAVRIVNDGLRYYPRSSSMWTLKGDINYQLKNYSGAITAYRNSIDFGDSSEINFRNVGVSHFWLTEYDTAIFYLTHAKALMDSDPAVYYYLGMCYKEGKKYDEAIENFSTAAKLQQNDFLAEVRTQIAASYYAQKKYSDALKYYQDALRENPDKKELIFYIAAVYDHYYEDKTVAIKYYQKYLTLGKNKDKKLVSYAMDRINALVEENHFKKAEKQN